MRANATMILLLLLAVLLFHPALVRAEEGVDLADLLPPGGEMKTQVAIFDRWTAAGNDHSPAAMAKFIDRNFVIRDGAAWASGSEKGSRRLSFDKALERLASADVAFFGETHDSAGAHLLEVFLTRLLSERIENLVVCLEMFERQAQPLLDAYLAGTIDEPTFLARLKDPAVKGLWGNYPKDYRPIVEMCKAQGIPMVAGFPPRSLAASLARKGKEAFYMGLSEEERSLCARAIVEPTDPSYRNSCIASFDSMADFRRGSMLAMVERDPSKLARLKPMILGTGGGSSAMSRAMAGSSEKIFVSQLLKDCTMAETIVDILRTRPGSKVLAIAGSGHVQNGGGVVGVLRVIAPEVKMVTSMYASPRLAAPPEKATKAPVDILFFGDRIQTYEQKLPPRVSLEEARSRIEELEKFALLSLFRQNDRDQRAAMADIEKIRGLPFKFPVYARIMTKEESQKEVGSWNDSKEARAYLDTQEKVLRGFNLFKGKVSLLEKQSGKRKNSIMGFYRSTDKTLYLFPHQAGQKKLRGLRVHETIHALQDQHFGMARLRKSVTSSDEDAALTALIEGEAVFLMMKVLGMNQGLSKMLHGKKPGSSNQKSGMSPHGGSGGMMAKKSSAPPDYFSERTKLMYRYGAQFLKVLVEKGGWDSVTEAFKKRPGTTHEILHPQAYLSGFRPVDLALPSLREGWVQLSQDRLGEADYFITLKLNGIGEEEAREAASAWRGDAYRLVSLGEDGSRCQLIFLSTWQSDKAARRSQELLQRVFADAKIMSSGKKVAMVREFRVGNPGGLPGRE